MNKTHLVRQMRPVDLELLPTLASPHGRSSASSGGKTRFTRSDQIRLGPKSECKHGWCCLLTWCRNVRPSLYVSMFWRNRIGHHSVNVWQGNLPVKSIGIQTLAISKWETPQEIWWHVKHCEWRGQQMEAGWRKPCILVDLQREASIDQVKYPGFKWFPELTHTHRAR